MKGNSNFKGKNGKFSSKGAKFKRLQWSKNKNKGPTRYGVGVRKSDNDNDDDSCVNNNILFDDRQSGKIKTKIVNVEYYVIFKIQIKQKKR